MQEAGAYTDYVRSGRSGQAAAVSRVAHAGPGSHRGILTRFWHRRCALQDRDRKCSRSLGIGGRLVARSARRSSGSGGSGICTRSWRSARAVLSRYAAPRADRFRERSSGTRVTLGSRRDDRRCRLFGMRPGSRGLGFARERRRWDSMRASRSG